jgi:hypothetical protein
MNRSALVLSICLSISGACAGNDPDPAVDLTQAAINGQFLGGCRDCNVVAFNVPGDVNVHSGVVVAPHLLLTEGAWTGVAPSQITFDSATNAALEIFNNGALSLIRTRDAFLAAPVAVAPANPSAGSNVTCKAFSGSPNQPFLEQLTAHVYYNGGDFFDDSPINSAWWDTSDQNDVGAPCFDGANRLAGIHYFNWTCSPGLCSRELSVANVQSWINSMSFLDVVKRSGTTAESVYSGLSSPRCLDVAWGGLDDHYAVNGFPCHGGLNQVWYLYPSIYSGYSMFVNGNSGKCLDVPNADTTSGVALQQYDCNNGPNQAWAMSFSPPTGIVFNPASAPWLCLSIDPNGHAVQATCLGADVQRWYQFWNPSPTTHP